MKISERLEKKLLNEENNITSPEKVNYVDRNLDLLIKDLQDRVINDREKVISLIKFSLERYK